MSLKEFVKTQFKKLCDSFNDKAWPDAGIQEEMEQEGWKFNILVSPPLYTAMCLPILMVTTPEGRPLYGSDADPADKIRYQQVLEEKRRAQRLHP